MKKKREIKLLIDDSHIKVSFEELFYDLIFVIIISKISALIVESQQLSFGLIMSSLTLFISLLYSWRIRLNNNNRVHILSNKTGSQMANIKFITYIEIVLMILILHSVETITYQFVILQFIVISIATFFTISQVRHNLGEYFQNDREKLIDVIRKLRSRDQQLINIAYVTERYGVIIILFLGEILASAFMNIEQTSTLFAAIILIIAMFNSTSSILNMARDTLKSSTNKVRDYRHINHYFTLLLINLLVIIVLIDASIHHGQLLKVLLTVSILLVNYLNHNLKSKLNLERKSFESIYFAFVTILVIWFANINARILLLLIIGIPVMYILIKKDRKGRDDDNNRN